MTSDGGATWRTVLSHDGYFWAIAVDPAGPGRVYAVGTAGVLATASPFVYPPVGDENFAAYVLSEHTRSQPPPVPPPRA